MLPLFAYVSADRIGHQCWETALHCAYANKAGKPLIIICSNNVANKSFGVLKNAKINFVSANWIFKIINNRRSKYIIRHFYKFIRLVLNGISKINYRQGKRIQNDDGIYGHCPAGGKYGRFTNDFAGIMFDKSLRMFPFLRSMPIINTAEDYLNFDIATKYFKPAYISRGSEKKGKDLLRKLGLSNTDWFVCLHVRESSFLGDTYREWRNQNVNRYLKTVQYITQLGGYVIRMGDSSMEKMPIMQNVIDYAHSEYKSDFADVYLSSKARFAIVNSSGYRGLPQLFGVPLLNVNVYPISPMDCYKESLIIYKKVYSQILGRELKVKEILSSSTFCSYNTDEEYKNAGIEVRQNSENEILDAVAEMNRLVTNNAWGEMNDKQKLFQSEVKKCLKNSSCLRGDRVHMFYPDGFCRIGTDYMRENWD